MGIGWLKEEFDAVAAPWAKRGRRMDEYVAVLRTLWCDETSTFSGEYYSLGPCTMEPKPVQRPHPPIHIGGESLPALRRAARHGQGWHTFNRTPEGLTEGLATLERLLTQEERSRDELTITVCPYLQPLDADVAEEYRSAGADAVAALFVALEVDGVRRSFDQLQPVIDRAAGC